MNSRVWVATFVIPGDDAPEALMDEFAAMADKVGIAMTLCDAGGDVVLSYDATWSFYGEKPDWWDDETEPRCDECGRHMEDDPEWPADGDGRCSTCSRD